MIDDKLIIPEFLKTKLKSLGFWFAVLLLLYLVGTLIPEGFDWRHFFSKGLVSPIWTPRASIVLRFINFPLLVALTLFGIIIRTYRYNPSPLPMLLAILSLHQVHSNNG